MTVESKTRLKQGLVRARQYSENLLAAFRSPDQWLHQVHSQANHALWFAGHMAVTDNFALKMIAPQHARDLQRFQDMFGLGSQPSARGEDYPSVAEVLEVMHERRGCLLKVLDGLGEADLSTATPEGAPAFMPDVGTVLEVLAWHEGLHSGQLAVTHRALGYPPLIGGGNA